MDGSWGPKDAAIPGPGWKAACLGNRLRPQHPNRYAFAAEGSERRRPGVGWIPDSGEEGTQTPLQTLERGWGSCRDFAVLFVEAARSLGFGARIVSGYLYDPDESALGSAGSGSTHAWAEIYVPGAGWITFDPTNQSIGGFNLIPVAVGRDIKQVMPVAGSFVGMTDAFLEMTVEVRVTSVPG